MKYWILGLMVILMCAFTFWALGIAVQSFHTMLDIFERGMK